MISLLTMTGSHVDRKSRGPEVTWTGSHVDRKSRGPEVTGTGSHGDRKSRGQEVTWTGSHVDRKSRGPEDGATVMATKLVVEIGDAASRAGLSRVGYFIPLNAAR